MQVYVPALVCMCMCVLVWVSLRVYGVYVHVCVQEHMGAGLLPWISCVFLHYFPN